MKKVISLLLVIVMVCSLTVTASAATSGKSTWMTSMEWQPKEFCESDFSRAVAVVLGVLDAGSYLNLDIDKIDWSKDPYVGLISTNLGVDIFVGRKGGGYYDIVYYYDGDISLYTFSTYKVADIKSNNPRTTFHKVNQSDITRVLEILEEN